MPYTLVPPPIIYPDVATKAWVVLSRLLEAPTRTVPRLSLIDNASEFALPFPSGVFPSKAVSRTVDYQEFDGLGRPLYDDGSPEGTTDPDDGAGIHYPPRLVAVEEEVIVNLQDNPDQFTSGEVFRAVERDFLVRYPFYDWAKLIVFDDRFDSISIYQNKQVASGFASASHPVFLGPVQGFFDSLTDPRGHILLVAPTLPGVDWYFQIRHGVTGGSGGMGPIEDIAQASRQFITTPGDIAEVSRIFPMENTPIEATMLTDAAGVEVTHFWIRTYANNQDRLEAPYPIVPFLLILGRSTA